MEKGKKKNDIRYISLEYSDYIQGEIYNEHEGMLEDFHIDENKLICLVRPNLLEGTKCINIVKVL